ncbi:MAG: DUF3857 domain-containing protein [Bacteroidia bacterium]|nr:MAG: DUF3857 domain-containing protein [Bacteroidia bacterium]
MTFCRATTVASLLFLFLVCGTLSGQSPYSVSLINPEMTKNAKAVVRFSEQKLTISSPSSASLEVTKAVTIMNETGRLESIYFGIDDKFITYHFDNLVIFDKEGKKVKDFGSFHLEPLITFAGSTLYSDVRYKSLDPDYRTYPFTAEISYTVDLRGFFYLPDWVIGEDYNISTEKARLTVETPAEYKLCFLEQNMPSEVTTGTDKGKSTYEWKVENDKAREKEPYALDIEQLCPTVFLAPGNFEIAKWRGSSATWRDFGKFLADLNQGRNILPANVTEKIKELSAQNPDTTALIRKLYALMQEKTRYVSVQIGIGGWQPIEAQEVEEKSYGDCKALSNYMKALLDAAGIKSHYAVIMAGEDAPDLRHSFPSNQFNHAILCVPGSPDTIWLECTSQRIPFNYLGSFTDDRFALLITDDGGRLVRTRKYGSEENRLTRKAIVTIDQTGNGKISVKTEYSSYFYDQMLPVLLSDFEDQKRTLSESVSIPGLTLVGFKISQPDKEKPLICEELNITTKGYASRMSDRMILPLNLMNKVSKLPALNTGRDSEVLLRREKLMIDTVIYKLPAGYTLSSTLNPVNLDSPFGSYDTNIEFSGNELIYIRRQMIRKGRFKVDDYPALIDYNNRVATADMVKIVLKRE